jgi:hypothetical protein
MSNVEEVIVVLLESAADTSEGLTHASPLKGDSDTDSAVAG